MSLLNMMASISSISFRCGYNGGGWTLNDINTLCLHSLYLLGRLSVLGRRRGTHCNPRGPLGRATAWIEVFTDASLQGWDKVRQSCSVGVSGRWWLSQTCVSARPGKKRQPHRGCVYKQSGWYAFKHTLEPASKVATVEPVAPPSGGLGPHAGHGKD